MSQPAPKKLNLIEIAKLAGVTKSTVSRVVRGQSGVAPDTRARVEHIIRVHHYRPSLFGRGLTGARTGLIGVLGRWMESGFTAEVIRGIDDEVKKRGGHLLCTFAPGIEEFIDIWRMFVSGGQVDGVILIAPPTDLYQQPIYAGDRPVVLCASKPPAKAKGWTEISSITLNNRTAMERLIDHLAAKGYRKLLHLAGMPDIHDSQERIQMFETNLAKHPGMTGKVIQGAWTAILAEQVMTEYFEAHKERPDAIVGFNDAVALGALQVLKARKIRVPDEIGVTGWDDIPFSVFAGLTTIHLPMVEIGWETAKLLYQELDAGEKGPASRHLVLETPLKARETTAK